MLGIFKKKKAEKSKRKAVASSKKEIVSPISEEPIENAIGLGNAQHQGARSYQEDSFGFSDISENVVEEKGILAVLADGMGGLSNGKAVSEMVVYGMLEQFNSGRDGQCTGAKLKVMADRINKQVCDTYCQDGRVSSGSTLVAASVYDGILHWLCIGDSRLYLKRGERMYQINEDHDFLNQLLDDVICGDASVASALADPQKDSLVGCIGKRDLDCYDYSKKGYRLDKGDILILCSDGIYNALSEAEMNMCVTEHAMDSCKRLVELVASKQLPGQDNNTVIVMSYR